MSKIWPSEVVAKLVIDGVGIVEAISNPVQHANQQNDYHDQQGANIAVVEVRRGQSYVVNYLHSDVVLRSDEIHRFTTFSGVLLHEM
ncbi:hypothetical protein DPMN_139058 [Dreissena polymorpha]|uniref:Uncharacterized protein n=1 Tax=Dreissena polymorpha TaxID=45954 RepID=A0A9D4JHU0_DREPO|nr:hypothetical protein DPMN_139058 [Dreissena polymorpha]